eukprot:1175997-Prorocentrum_minimum.AAC.6
MRSFTATTTKSPASRVDSQAIEVLAANPRGARRAKTFLALYTFDHVGDARVGSLDLVALPRERRCAKATAL